MSPTTVETTIASIAARCDFCDEFSGGIQNSFAIRYRGLLQERTILATSNFKVIPTLGQIVEGYLLIVPISHYRALADMPPEPIQELVRLKDQVRAALLATYGPCIFFEHGARSANAGGCGINHAHLHAVPLSEEKDPIATLKEEFPFESLRANREITTEANGSNPYLYYEDLHSNTYVFDVEYLPSQYVRRLLAQNFGKVEWDWRKYEREEALLSSMARLSQVFGTSLGKPQS